MDISFNADLEVAKIYKKDKKFSRKLKNKLPKYVTKFPIDKNEITNAILNNQNNLNKIINIVHKIRKKLNLFLKKNKSKKIVVLDIPLLIENKLFNKKDLLVFVDSNKKDIDKRIEKRPNFNSKLLNIFKKTRKQPELQKKKSHFIIKNTFTKKLLKMKL